MRRTPLVLTLLTPILFAWPCAAQTLSSRPAFFADPLLATDPAHGELVLGQTTLLAALRIFAVELQDSVRIPLGHPSNPDTVWTGADIGGPRSAPRAHHRLDVGTGHYILYFDKNERLIAAKADRTRLPRAVRREDLVAQYPTLQNGAINQVGDERAIAQVEAPLAPCVSAVASIGNGELRGTVLEFGYRYTCATRPARRRAVLYPAP